MGQINVEKNVGGIEGLYVITPVVHGDARGYFMETYSQRDMKENGININFVQNNQSLIPRGFAHGFLVLSDTTEFCYKCDEFYHANGEGGLAWNDPEIGIQWPKVEGAYQGSASAEGYTLKDGTKLNLSEKDQKWPGFNGDIRK